MAHIVSFEIEGLVGRKEPYCKKLNRDVNIFFGLNGCGKTSLLRILNSAMNINAAGLQNVPFKSAKVEVYSIDYERVFTYSIKKLGPVRKPTGEAYTPRDEVEPDEKPSEEPSALKWTKTPEKPVVKTRRWAPVIRKGDQ